MQTRFPDAKNKEAAFDETMNRRRFLWRLAAAFQAAVLAPAGDLPAAEAPVNFCGRLPAGMRLRDVARKKLHHNGGRFSNPFCTAGYRRPLALLRWKLFSSNRYKHLYARETERPVDIDWAPVVGHDGLSVTFLNHASVLIRDPDGSVLVDPIFFGLLPFIHDFSPLVFDVARMPRPDAVLITHGHYDHLDTETLTALGPTQPIVAPPGYEAVFEGIGLKHRTSLDWFETAASGNWRVTLLPAHHWTMRNPFVGPNTALWGGYLIHTAGGRTIYVSGDTGYFDGFADIGREADIDLAIINLGAYAPRWFMAQSHMDPAQTVEAFRQLRAKRLMAVHWGAFRLGDEPVYLPPLDLAREMEKAGLADRLVHLEPGQSVFWDGSGPIGYTAARMVMR